MKLLTIWYLWKTWKLCGSKETQCQISAVTLTWSVRLCLLYRSAIVSLLIRPVSGLCFSTLGIKEQPSLRILKSSTSMVRELFTWKTSVYGIEWLIWSAWIFARTWNSLWIRRLRLPMTSSFFRELMLKPKLKSHLWILVILLMIFFSSLIMFKSSPVIQSLSFLLWIRDLPRTTCQTWELSMVYKSRSPILSREISKKRLDLWEKSCRSMWELTLCQVLRTLMFGIFRMKLVQHWATVINLMLDVFLSCNHLITS